MLFWTPIFFEFQKSIGISEPDIFRIQTWYYLLFCLVEIPTGFLSDKIGAKTSMTLGSVSLIMSQLVALGFLSFDGQLMHFALVALARSLISGASSSYLYEFLEQRGAKHDYKLLEGKARSYSLFGRVLCFAVTGPLYELNMRIPFALTLATAVGSLIVIRFMPDIRPIFQSHVAGDDKKGHESGDVGTGVATVTELNTNGEKNAEARAVRLKNALMMCLQKPQLLFLMLQGVGLFVLARIVAVNLFQPILKDSNYPVATFGLAMGLLSLVEAVGAANPQWIRKYFSNLNSVYLLTAALALSQIALPFLNQIGVAASLSVFFFICGISYPIQRQLMNDAIPDRRYRATLLSLESILDRAFAAAVAFLLERMSSVENQESYLSTEHLFNFSQVNKFLFWGGFFTLAMLGLQKLFEPKSLKPLQVV